MRGKAGCRTVSGSDRMPESTKSIWQGLGETVSAYSYLSEVDNSIRRYRARFCNGLYQTDPRLEISLV